MQHSGENASRKSLIGLLVIGVLLMAVLGWVLAESRLAAWRYAAGTATNLVTALQRDIDRTISSYDLSMQATVRALDVPAFALVDPVSRQQLLFDGSIEARNMGSMFVMDADGKVIHDSGPLSHGDKVLADRDYFTIHRDQPDAGLYISRPYRSRMTGEWSVALSRRIAGPQGQFAGVVVGSVRYSYFTALFSKLDLGPESTITLFDLGGTLMYRSPLMDAEIGRTVTDVSVLQRLREGRLAPFDGISRVDATPRLFAFAQVGTLPLVLSVNTALSTVYAPWVGQATVVGGVSLVLVLAGLLLLRAIQTQQRRREQAERDLVRSTGLQQAYFDNAPDALFIVDVADDGTLRYEGVNRSCEILTGVSAAAAMGKRPADLFPAALAMSIEQRYRACLTAGTTYSYSDTRDLPAGQRDCNTVLVPIQPNGGRITLLLGSTRDMTEQNRLQSEQHHASKMEAVGRLTAGVAHDFNNYLQTIVSSIDIMAADYLAGPEAMEVALTAQKAANSGARLVHHLLAFSRQQILQPRRLSVANLLAETHKLVGSSALGPGIRFKIAVEPFTDDIQVDPTQAESCLLNLLLNARDAMPNGGSLVLHARNATLEDGVFGNLGAGRHVIIAVHDTGRGMDDDTKSRAFEPFFTTKMFGKGSGLGLSMAQGFCRQSGGDIRLLNGGRVGTRVELWLPAATAGMLVGEERDFNLATIGQGTGRVLLVEDEQDVSAALAAVMVSAGFEVVAVTNATDGMARLHDRDPYDAILADYALPDMPGPHFLACAAAQVPGLPMLLLSGYELDDATVLSLPPLTKLLRKPARRLALLNALREAIGESRATILAA
ncbi:ATP-binding protein [Acidisphaera sp. L21]|uniref:ATP-binding protein n=1 Tax=Acidisphaera sp. L21 TaxID=1641851 RepID=UPI00131C2F82|nr:cache domain-containing protein [Acidisphaera sp. L21]